MPFSTIKINKSQSFTKKWVEKIGALRKKRFRKSRII
jgi:hypothetical protein